MYNDDLDIQELQKKKLGPIKGVILACIITLTITAVWYGVEWIQFGKLQWNRNCDEIVTLLYFIALAIGFSKW